MQTAVQTDFSRFDELQEPEPPVFSSEKPQIAKSAEGKKTLELQPVREQRTVIVPPAQERHTAKAPEKPVQKQVVTKPIEKPAPSKAVEKIESAAPEKPSEESETAKPAQGKKTVQDEKPAPVQTEKKEPVKPLPKQKADPENKTGFIWSAGLLAEANMNTPKSYVFGTGLYTLCMLPVRSKAGTFSAGIKGLYSSDFKRYRMVDTAFLFRWNFYNPVQRTNGKTTDDAGFFIQAEGGAAFAWNGQNAAAKPFVFGLAQAVLGYRYTVRNFFIEPYVYAGYPVLWGAGIAGGLRIGD